MRKLFGSDIDLLQGLYDACALWDNAFEYASNLKFKTWTADKNANPDIKEEAKKARNKVKEQMTDLISDTLLYNSQEAFADIYVLHDNLTALKDLVLRFEQAFQAKKKSKNIIDFTDIEHYALNILVKVENGEYVPTEVAKQYQEKFEEIAIDEYQDSNQVQELILKSVSRGNNIFMVGDVKQSIYKFRQAYPKLFFDKYDTYSLDGNENGMKIQLFKNFRSNQNILNITNTVFENMMSRSLGNVDYTEEEYLNLGADYPNIENGVGKSELHIIDTKSEKSETTEEEEEIREESEKELTSLELEAIFVARKIRELIQSGKLIKCKDGSYKKLEYRDIVILLRSTKISAPIFEKELLKNGIPVFSDISAEYLETMEVQTIINVLKILDNPLDDINLVSVMRSPVGGFSDNEILEIRLENREDSVFSNLQSAREKGGFAAQEKIQKFLQDLETWKQKSEMLSLAELIWKIYLDTGFLEYVGLMPNGVLRQANLRMLFERAKEYEKTSFNGLFHFIRFVEKLKSENSDMASAKVIGESENVVRMMSIHKSKGLEFPVVFLCQANKNINLQDLKGDILLHRDIGFGPQCIDYERKIEYPTAAKQAIKILGKEEAIAEEMRILYVALTRAKEKLIITATIKDFAKEEEAKSEIAKAYQTEENKLNSVLFKKYISYWNWIYLVYLQGKLQDELELVVHSKQEFENECQVDSQERKFDFEQNVDFEQIQEIFAWQYPDQVLVGMPEKTSVSQIKSLQNGENTGKQSIGLEEISANFAQNKQEITPAKKGTLMHLVLQKLDFKKSYTKQDLQEFVEKLVMKKIILEEERNSIDLSKIEAFLQSEICLRMKDAKVIEKEKAFCLRTKLEEFENREIAVQGIMDLYFVDQNDRLVLVDYKTDFVKNENDLKEKYFKQLEIYKKALETSLNRKVDEIYIYSISQNKLIIL